MGGALLAHTIAGLLDGRRSLSLPATSFAPLSMDADGGLTLRPFYRTVVEGKQVLLADDVRNTGKTFERAKAVIEGAGGTVVATDRNLRSTGSDRRSRRAERGAGRVPARRRTFRPTTARCARRGRRSRVSRRAGVPSGPCT